MRVEELLNKRDIPFVPMGKDYVVSCLNPEHPDLHPSMRIDQVTGIFNCLSCGFKGNLFKLFGVKPNFLMLKREAVRKRLYEKMADSIGLSMPKGYVPYIGNWRGISPATYKKFEAFEHPDTEYVGRIVFPIRDFSGRIVAFQGRHTSGETPKYRNSPPGAKLPLFPMPNIIEGSVIVVEGLYDMLNLYEHGLDNVVCCFGVHRLDEEKLGILKIRGVEELVIFLDGDEAGQAGAEKIIQKCENVDLPHRNVCLSGRDPGDLDFNAVQKLKRTLYG